MTGVITSWERAKKWITRSNDTFILQVLLNVTLFTYYLFFFLDTVHLKAQRRYREHSGYG